MLQGLCSDEDLQALVASAAEAQERFGDDELERSAEEACRQGRHQVRRFLAVDQGNGWLMANCLSCGSTTVTPLTWASPWPEDYVAGHPLNAWGAF